MKRIDIYYDGAHYSVGGRRPEDLRREVEEGLARGVHWLEVNDGEGMMRTAHLLLTPGIPLAIIPIPAEELATAPDVLGAEGEPPVAG